MKRPSYLELGRRQAFGRPVRKPLPPLPPATDPATVADFDLGTWRVRPSLGRMTRADRIVALDEQTLKVLLTIHEAPAGGVNRDELAARVFGPAGIDENGDKLRRALGALRRVFSEDGAVRVLNAPGDCYVFEIGAPIEGRTLPPGDSSVLLENPGGVDAWLRRGRRRATGIALAGAVVFVIAWTLMTILDRGHVVLLGTVAHVTPLATEPGEKTSPSFSPDGRQVVYAWRRPDGTEKLYLRALTGAAPRVLTTGDGHDSHPAWSPKGDLIAFQRRTEQGCSVLAVTPTGSDPRLLGDCDFGGGGPMTWMRDGAALVYTHRTAWRLPTQLVSVGIADGKMSGITNPVSGMPGDASPTLAPTGRRLAFTRARAVGSEDLMLLELGGVQPERVSRDGWPTAGAAWEPTGLSLIFASPRGGRDALWRTRLAGVAPDLLLAGNEPLRAPALSNDGRTLAFERWRVQSRLIRRAADPAVAATTWRESGALERAAQLSDDHTRVVFVSNRDGHDRLWIAPVGGGDARPLTGTEADYLETPRWSHDGRHVTYTATHKGKADIWIVDVATGRESQVTSDGRSRAPSFSHDGQWLYYASAQKGPWQIWRRAWRADGDPEQVTTLGGLLAIEAPGGDTLYYVRADRRGLWRRSRDPGGDDTLVSPDLTPLDWRNWDVANDAVWFVMRPTDGEPTLARYVFADGRTHTVAAVPTLLADSGLTVLPDGTALIAEAAQVTVDLDVAALD